MCKDNMKYIAFPLQKNDPLSPQILSADPGILWDGIFQWLSCFNQKMPRFLLQKKTPGSAASSLLKVHLFAGEMPGICSKSELENGDLPWSIYSDLPMKED